MFVFDIKKKIFEFELGYETDSFLHLFFRWLINFFENLS